MKNQIKIFLICTILIIYFLPNNAIGMFPYKDEEGTQDIHGTIRQSNAGADRSSSDNYSPLEAFCESVSSFSYLLVSSFLGSNDDTLSTTIPINNCNKINLEEYKEDNSITSGTSNIIPLTHDEKESSQQKEQPLLLPYLIEKQGNTTDAENKKSHPNAKPKNIDYTRQIALGQKKGIRLPKSPYKEYLPIIETFIQKVIQDKIEKPVKVQVLVDFDERLDFREAFINLVDNYTKYPSQFSWSQGNKGSIKLKDGTLAHISEVTLVSYAKKREQVENEFVYHISQEEAQKVNMTYVYDVAMRSHFTLEDFKFNNAIKVRLLNCQGTTKERILEEFQQFLTQMQSKDHYPFHIIGITFNPKVNNDHGCMLGGVLGKVSEVNFGLSSRGTVFDPPKGLIYLCLNNTNRTRLDLHGKKLLSGEYEGRSVNVAGHETKEFIMQAYETFQEDVTVCTGRGKHVNANKTQGALKIAFNDWIRDTQLAPLIKMYFLLEGDGEYKVIFVKTCKLNLKDTKPQNIVPAIKKTIVQMVAQKKRRLHITLGPDEEIPNNNREFDLMLNLYADLQDHDPQLVELLLPISFESKPGEMKIIFNQPHSKSRWHFTHFNSHGSTGTYGTIRKQGD